MSLILDMTRQAFVQTMRTGDTHEKTLHIVVVRLLSIALMMMDWRESQDQTGFLPTPEGYRTWPVVESQSASCGLPHIFSKPSNCDQIALRLLGFVQGMAGVGGKTDIPRHCQLLIESYTKAAEGADQLAKVHHAMMK